MAKVRGTTARGYGSAHQRERAKWKTIVDAGRANCTLCKKPIIPGTKWHLDHTTDRTGYRGAAHAHCNVVEGGRQRHLKRIGKPRGAWKL